jgi:hypothetical protein
LIYAVRDPILKQERARDGGKLTNDFQTVVVDPGVEDKRLLVVEAEFASVLKVAKREGNTVSVQVRQAWDSGNLRLLNKNSPLRATGAHISIIGHITKIELHRHLDDNDAANGFANRFLWVAVRRSKELPDGGNVPYEALQRLGESVQAVIVRGHEAGNPRRDPDAAKLWREVYSELSRDRDGLWGLVTNRAEAQVVRLSLIYALLDGSLCVRKVHLEAALAAWRYCEASAAWIFGQHDANPLAEAILAALKDRPDGMTRSELFDFFQRHKKSEEIDAALRWLAELGKARYRQEKTAGRPKVRWLAL